ncbi:MAG: hypothetical protein ACUVUC_14430 [Thermoguttaceae bacterium]
MSRVAASARCRTTSPVALFPFLAVLVCTMGALIVILVVLARQSRLQAAQAAAAQAEQIQADLAAAQKIVKWRVSEMAASGQRAQARLAQARLLLAHLEQHARQLRGQLEQLQTDWEELRRLKSHESRRRDDLLAERDRLAAEIAQLQQQILQAQNPPGHQKSYAIVPYEGPSGTRRRPLYIECRADAVVLQPEGIVLTEADFPEPLGPDNPLDTALRAARESLLGQNEIRGDGTDEPYALLLVRPSGIMAYYAARQAMKSWKGEIGYELIGEDWKLEFPRPDPVLAQTLREAVQSARAHQRQRALLEALASGSRGHALDPGWLAEGAIEQGGQKEDEPEPGGARGPGRAPSRSRDQPPASDPGEAAQDRVQGPILGPESRSTAPRRSQALATSRGVDWALPNAARGSIPLTRPMRVDCLADRLVIAAESGVPARQILLGARTEDSIDAFVSAVWEHIQAWGIAGRGMHWRPVLKVRVAPGGETRFGELQAILHQSGLVVERKEDHNQEGTQ